MLEQFRLSVVLANNYVIHKLQGDFDTVVLSAEVQRWLALHSIKLQVSAPYSHAQNGQIERDMQNVLDKARTLMSASNAPRKYWE